MERKRDSKFKEKTNEEKEDQGGCILGIFGFGITQLFELIWLLIKVFFIASILGGIMMYINYNGHGFAHKFTSFNSAAIQFSLGNLGFNDATCNFLPTLAFDDSVFRCSKGML